MMDEHQNEEAKQRENDAGYGVAYDVAAGKTASLAGKSLMKEQKSQSQGWGCTRRSPSDGARGA
jgi:hypothetical protein